MSNPPQNSAPVGASRIELAKKFLRFGSVGFANTLIDYAIYNLLLLTIGKHHTFIANAISSSLALMFSYYMNMRFVFKHGRRFDVRSAAMFVGFTLFGLWVLQGGLLSLIVHVVKSGYPAAYTGHELLVANLAKLVASAASIVWNFTTYNAIIFRGHPKGKAK